MVDKVSASLTGENINEVSSKNKRNLTINAHPTRLGDSDVGNGGAARVATAESDRDTDVPDSRNVAESSVDKSTMLIAHQHKIIKDRLDSLRNLYLLIVDGVRFYHANGLSLDKHGLELSDCQIRNLEYLSAASSCANWFLTEDEEAQYQTLISSRPSLGSVPEKAWVDEMSRICRVVQERWVALIEKLKKDQREAADAAAADSDGAKQTRVRKVTGNLSARLKDLKADGFNQTRPSVRQFVDEYLRERQS